jgi:HEAT repeat protein
MSTLNKTQREELLEKLRSGDEQQLSDAIATVKKEGDAELVPDLLTVLATTDDMAVANAIAQTFFDLKDPVALDAMIDRLMHHGEAILIQGESYRTKDGTNE